MSPASSAFFEFAIDGISDELLVLGFEGREGVSQLFEFEVKLSSDAAGLAFDDALGKPALLTIHTDNDEPRYLHGIVGRFEETGTNPKSTTYTATVVPRFWTLGLRQDCCIYQELSTPDVIKKVLEDAGLAEGEDFSLNLQGSYNPREYCVQYRESDFAFVSRLMEEDGIFYFFEHSDSGHKLVIADHTGAYGVIPGETNVPYREDDSGMQSVAESVNVARYSRSLRPGKVVLTDYNFTKVDLNLASEVEGDAETSYEIYDFPGRYIDTGHGSERSTVRMESLRAERDLLVGESDCRRLVSGHKFTLEEHPRDDMNQEYLLLRVKHVGRQPQAGGADAVADLPDEDGEHDEAERMYEAEFEAIPSGVLYRAPMVTPKAIVDGPQTAVVTGPSGEEIYCDEHGRVKVQFHWDRLGQKDDKTSCWMRVSQPWSGTGYGGMVIPRIGNEVIVSFLEGDPDRPIVTGHVYNGSAMFGYSLPGDKTRTSIKTYSSPGGNGFNELRFEDAAGSEEVFLHAQKDWNIQVLNDRTQSIGNDHTHTVGHDEKMEVKNDRTRKVGANESVDVVGNETIKIGGDLTETVGGSLSLTVTGAATVKVTGAVSNAFEAAQSTTVGADDSLAVSGAQNVAVTGNRGVAVDGDDSLNVKGGRSANVKGADTLAVDGDHSMDLKGDSAIEVGKALAIKAGDEIKLECGSASITLKKNGDIEIKGNNINIKGSGNITVKGSAVAQN